MRKLKFQDVLEYLKAGVANERFEHFLRDDPDGPELLEQAMLVYEMLNHQVEPADDDGDAADFLGVAAESHAAEEPTHEYSYTGASKEIRDASEEFFARPNLRDPSYLIPEISRLVSDISQPRGQLGTLGITIKDETVTLSFRPGLPNPSRPADIGKTAPKRARVFYQSSAASSKSTDDPVDAIQIQGSDVNISLPGTLSVFESLNVRLTHGLENLPATGRELIFMPASGPFVRVVTDKDGMAELPPPKTSGILRVGTDRPELLHIELKK